MVTGSYQLSPSEKKRIRDRRGQKRLREKRETHIQALERQVASCNQHHGANRTAELISVVNQLYRENQALRARHARFRAALLEDDPVPTRTPPSTEDIESISLPGPQQKYPGVDQVSTLSLPFNPLPADTSRRADQVQSPAPNPGQAESQPSDKETSRDTGNQENAWYLVPMSTTQANQIAFPGTSPWFEYPDLVAACPTTPSPLDLLHGTRRNFLADEIHRGLRQRAIRDAECLAFGWHLYHFSKWLVMPDPATFARLAPFHRPIEPQFQVDHPRAIDMVVWPQMRANLLKNWTSYDFMDVMGYLSCCTKLRWPWGKPILERDPDDDLQMRDDYLETITRESAWGLTPEFIERYPELVEGMDVEGIRFRMGPPDEEG